MNDDTPQCPAVRPRNRASLAAEAAFRARLAELGATLLEPEWLGARNVHHVLCVNGHATWPKPNNVQQGSGICRACVGTDPAQAEAAFRQRLAALGATPLYERWGGVEAPHLIRCREGHESTPRPHDIQQGAGPCRTCSGKHPGIAEAAFRERLAAIGAVPLYDTYRGVSKGHEVRCANGHICYPWPAGLQQGRGICPKCSLHDPEDAEARFRQRMEDLGMTVTGTYAGAHVRVSAVCADGHACMAIPHTVRKGAHPCATCGERAWDIFYVVASAGVVKFGITSRSPERRLGEHAKDGFTTVIRVVTGLAADLAVETEAAILAALADAGEIPVRGREYFDISCLGLVLDVADGWLPWAAAPILPAEPGQGTLFGLPLTA